MRYRLIGAEQDFDRGAVAFPFADGFVEIGFPDPAPGANDIVNEIDDHERVTPSVGTMR